MKSSHQRLDLRAKLLIYSEALKDVNLFDEDYFLCLSDSDWFVRAQRLGWKAFVAPQAVAWHNDDYLTRLGKSCYYSWCFSGNRLILTKKHMVSRLPLPFATTFRHDLLGNLFRRRWIVSRWL